MLISRSLWRNGTWSSAGRTLVWTANFNWIGLVSMIAIVAVTLPQNGGSFGPNVYIGWPNRLVMAAYCIWLFALTRRSARLTSSAART